MQPILVKELMKTNVITIKPTASLKDGLKLMKQNKIKSIIVEKGKPSDAYGLLQYENVAEEIIANEGDIDLLNVYDVATKPVIQVSKELDSKHVIRLMLDHKLNRILVVDNNELEGFITLNDVIASLIDDAIAE